MAMTYVDALTVAIDSLSDEAVVEKLTALREQMGKRHASSKPSKKQVENEAIKAEILEVLASAESAMTCTEIGKALEGDYSVAKISALMRQLVEAEKVEKTVEKKVSRFSLI